MATAVQRGPLHEGRSVGGGAASWKEVFLGAVAIAVAVSVFVYFPDRDDGSGAVLGGFSALIGSTVGLAAVRTARPLPGRTTSQHLNLAVSAIIAGVAVGVANLGANYGMALLDSAIYEQMVTRWAEFSTWSIVFAGPIMEEIAYRLALLGGLAWIVSRFTGDKRTIFFVALGVSALLFGVAHVSYGGVTDPVYAIGMAVKSSAGGVAFGWVFWRWGLPYSIICHCVANATHLLLMPALF